MHDGFFSPAPAAGYIVLSDVFFIDHVELKIVLISNRDFDSIFTPKKLYITKIIYSFAVFEDFFRFFALK